MRNGFIKCFISLRTGRWNRPTLLNRCVLRSSTFGKCAIDTFFRPQRGRTGTTVAPLRGTIEGETIALPQVPLRGTQRLSKVRPLRGLSFWVCSHNNILIRIPTDSIKCTNTYPAKDQSRRYYYVRSIHTRAVL